MSAASGVADVARGWPLGPDSRFGLGCITKLLVGIITTKLCDEGSLDLDEEVGSTIPELASRGITIAHLASHSAGYQGPLLFNVNQRAFSWDSFAAGLPSTLQTFHAGAAFNYENTGHVIIGEVIRRRTGRSFREHLEDVVLEPLGIRPGLSTADFKDPARYVSAHVQDSAGKLRGVLSPSLGGFWQSSLSDLTLTLDEMRQVGEAIVGVHPRVSFPWAQAALRRRLIRTPSTVSGKLREHNPHYFTPVCAEYSAGWYGYAGSASGQTCSLRFNPEKRMVCAVGMNAWLPVARDALVDKICNSRTHPDAGVAGGLQEIDPGDLAGRYVGGGNLIREADVQVKNGEVTIALTGAGLQAPPLTFPLNTDGQLVPHEKDVTPALGFFREPGQGGVSVLIGMSALARITGRPETIAT